MSQRYFYGWNVVAATFVMGLFSFGLGFYGVTVYGPPARTWWHTLLHKSELAVNAAVRRGQVAGRFHRLRAQDSIARLKDGRT
jgi:hypothetical protein